MHSVHTYVDVLVLHTQLSTLTPLSWGERDWARWSVFVCVFVCVCVCVRVCASTCDDECCILLCLILVAHSSRSRTCRLCACCVLRVWLCVLLLVARLTRPARVFVSSFLCWCVWCTKHSTSGLFRAFSKGLHVVSWQLYVG